MDAYEKLIAFNRANPSASDTYKLMQRWQISNKPDDGVFCPSGKLYTMSRPLAQAMIRGATAKRDYNTLTEQDIQALQLFWGLHLFGAWRNTLGIYRIDKHIFGDIIKSAIPTDTPSSVFSRLPEWCVYIELPDELSIKLLVNENGDSRMFGFWALFDHQNINNTPKLTLNLVPNLERVVGAAFDQYQPIQIFIDDNLTIGQAIDQWYQNVSKIDGVETQEAAALDLEFARKMLSLLLWLCAEEPDISNIQGEPLSKDALRMPKYRTNKKTGVFIPPDKPIIYEIGKRLGGEIRTYNEKIGASDSRISSRKRPHIRRGHWHGVWSGTGQNKEFKIYWQPAIFVNAN